MNVGVGGGGVFAKKSSNLVIALLGKPCGHNICVCVCVGGGG
jgi:hypothetical protein